MSSYTKEIERLRIQLGETGKETRELKHKSHKVDGLEIYVETLKKEIHRLGVFFFNLIFRI